MFKEINDKILQLQLEKLIVGVEEPVFIKGIGQVTAKVDSGNSAYNVLHGEDFYYQGDTVVFTTFDDNGSPHKVSKKVQDKITINIGGGHTEERPIVLFSVKFANDEYLNVPFSIGNRATNTHKCLLGKEFIVKKLDALIDASSKNIADKNIDVAIPIHENAEDGAPEEPKQPEQPKPTGVKRRQDYGRNNILPSRKSKNPSGATSTLGKMYRFGWALFKMYKAFADNSNSNLAEWFKNIWTEYKKEIEKIQQNDKYLIFKALNKQFHNTGENIYEYVKDPQVFKVLDYIGGTYKGDEFAEEASKTAHQQQKQQQQQQRQYQPPNVPQSQVMSLPAPPKVKPKIPGQPMSESVEYSDFVKNCIIAEGIKEKMDKNKFETAADDVNDELKTIYYLVIYDGSKVHDVQEILNHQYSNLKGQLVDMFKNMNTNFGRNSSSKGLMQSIIRGLNANKIFCCFAYCQGKGANRKAYLLDNNFNDVLIEMFMATSPADYIEWLTFDLGLDEYPNRKTTFYSALKKSELTEDIIAAFYANSTFYSNKYFGYHQTPGEVNSLTKHDRLLKYIMNGKQAGRGGLEGLPINLRAAFNVFKNHNVEDKLNPETIHKELEDGDDGLPSGYNEWLTKAIKILDNPQLANASAGETETEEPKPARKKQKQKQPEEHGGPRTVNPEKPLLDDIPLEQPNDNITLPEPKGGAGDAKTGGEAQKPEKPEDKQDEKPAVESNAKPKQDRGKNQQHLKMRKVIENLIDDDNGGKVTTVLKDIFYNINPKQYLEVNEDEIIKRFVDAGLDHDKANNYYSIISILLKNGDSHIKAIKKALG